MLNSSLLSPLQAALAYREAGLSVIPLTTLEKFPDSESLIKAGYCSRTRVASWNALRTRVAGVQELESWFRDSTLNLGIVTGFQDIYALDFDLDGSYASWVELCPQWARQLPTQRTHRGYHVLFRMKNIQSTRYRLFLPCHLANNPKAPEVSSLLGLGTWMVAHPSVHPSGSTYRWLDGQGPWDLGIPCVSSMEELGLLIGRVRPRFLAFAKRWLTEPRLARAQFAAYMRTARGVQTNLDHGV